MPRALLPGRWNRHGRAIPDPQVSELDNIVPLRPDLPRIPIPLTGGRVPRARRMRRFLRALWAHLTAPRWRL